MKPGQLALLRFPQSNLDKGKLRPVLLLARLKGDYPDWLVAMISGQLQHAIPGFDELIRGEDHDFPPTGLKQSSAIRVGRLAVANAELLVGAIGELSNERLNRIRRRIADWILTTES